MELRETPPSVVLATVVIGLLIILLFFLFWKKQKNIIIHRNIILICGPCGAGKTLLSYRLCWGQSPTTITSMEPSHLELGAKKVALVDYPGHIRLRHGLFSKYLERAKVILFVIDSSRVQSQAREAAEFIYDLFTNPLIDKVDKFVVLCNKNDLGSTRPPARVKLTLQQELEKIKKTRKSLEEDDDDSYVPLGREGKPFSFDQDSPVDIEFCGLSAKVDDMDSLSEKLGLEQ